jgi:hypothetical protein
MGNRPSGDVDLFTSWQHRGEFPELKAAVIAALESAGYKASVVVSAETFTRLALTDPADGAEEKVQITSRVRKIYDAKLKPPLRATAPRRST